MPREHNKFAHGFGGKEFREDTTQWMTHLCSMMPGTMVRNTQKLGDWNHVKTHSLTCLVGDVVIWDLSQGCWPGLWGYPPVSSLSASTGFLTARLSTHVSQESIEYPWHFTLLVEAVPWVGDGQGGLVCCDSWGHKELDMTEWLNWTELNLCLKS